MRDNCRAARIERPYYLSPLNLQRQRYHWKHQRTKYTKASTYIQIFWSPRYQIQYWQRVSYSTNNSSWWAPLSTLEMTSGERGFYGLVWTEEEGCQSSTELAAKYNITTRYWPQIRSHARYIRISFRTFFPFFSFSFFLFFFAKQCDLFATYWTREQSR